jgi:hypothetical protein
MNEHEGETILANLKARIADIVSGSFRSGAFHCFLGESRILCSAYAA